MIYLFIYSLFIYLLIYLSIYLFIYWYIYLFIMFQNQLVTGFPFCSQAAKEASRPPKPKPVQIKDKKLKSGKKVGQLHLHFLF